MEFTISNIAEVSFDGKPIFKGEGISNKVNLEDIPKKKYEVEVTTSDDKTITLKTNTFDYDSEQDKLYVDGAVLSNVKFKDVSNLKDMINNLSLGINPKITSGKISSEKLELKGEK